MIFYQCSPMWSRRVRIFHICSAETQIRTLKECEHHRYCQNVIVFWDLDGKHHETRYHMTVMLLKPSGNGLWGGPESACRVVLFLMTPQRREKCGVSFRDLRHGGTCSRDGADTTWIQSIS
ncbi:hypothetical protein AMECASPLE_037062 [Ameca splendens]|uniref:Uncharacterized protein n=1 Tax=Ameca splendens TaxID=208324 RepID=A0ABV1AGV1_9TELE